MSRAPPPQLSVLSPSLQRVVARTEWLGGVSPTQQLDPIFQTAERSTSPSLLLPQNPAPPARSPPPRSATASPIIPSWGTEEIEADYVAELGVAEREMAAKMAELQSKAQQLSVQDSHRANVSDAYDAGRRGKMLSESLRVMRESCSHLLVFTRLGGQR